MQGIMESLFDVVYLSTVTFIGIYMMKNSNGNKQYKLFGFMAIVLGVGDAFHLIPRMVALLTTGLNSFTYYLGIGKFITSITMTFFYVILYHVYKIRYDVKNDRTLTYSIYGLSIIRIVLCLLPQNKWTSIDAPLSMGIIRNIPFLILGILIIIIFYKQRINDKSFKDMWLTIVLSFAFYLPVVLFADKFPLIGMLMIPKTCAYVWTILIGFNDMKNKGEIKI